MGIVSSFLSGGQAQAQAAYMAQVARNAQAVAQRNATIQEQFARDAEQRGVIDEDAERRRTAQAIGAQRARLAGQGGDVNDGSAIDLIGDAARAGEMEALTVRSDAQRRAYLHRLAVQAALNQAGLHHAEAGFATARAARARDAAWLSLGDSLLGTAASIYGSTRRT